MKFDGSWEITSLTAVIAKANIDSIKSKLTIPENVIATLIAIAILEKRFADKKKAWNLIVAKSMTFINSNWKPTYGLTADAALVLVKSLI